MQRHHALRDLSRDHMFALRLAHHVDQAVRRIENGPSLAEATGNLVRAWEEDLFWHFREEEEVLLPIRARHGRPMEDPDLRQMLDDHAWLRNALARLSAEHQDGRLDAGFAGEVGRRLHDHVRLEERQVFPRLEELLTAPELEELRAASEAFRRRWRSHEVIGPYRTRG